MYSLPMLAPESQVSAVEQCYGLYARIICEWYSLLVGLVFSRIKQQKYFGAAHYFDKLDPPLTLAGI